MTNPSIITDSIASVEAEDFFEKYPFRKLNLGCGEDRRPGYLNIDMHEFQKPDLIGNILDLRELPSSCFDEIIAQDVLEHFRWRDTPRALLEWNRLLSMGGRIFIRTTYLNGVLRLFELPEIQSVQMQFVVLTGLFSNQLMAGDYHLTGFTEILLRFYLWAAGFEIDEITVRDGWLFEVWARKQTDFSYPDLVTAVRDDVDLVQQIYLHVLKREADTDGLQHFSTELSEGRITRDAFIKAVILSDENQKRLIAAAPKFELTFHQPGSTPE